MYFKKRFLAVALAAPLALAACGGDDTFELVIDQYACSDTERKFPVIPAAAEVTLRVTGPGMSPIQAKASGSSGTAELPEIPFGSDRVVTVSANAGGRLVAYGESQPFDVSESGTPKVTVVVQAVNAFTGAADIGNNCVEMTAKRAAHTAVAMKGGKVLIVGGVGKLGTGGQVSDFVTTAEVYDPSVGTFVPLPKPCDSDVCYEAAFGKGVLLPDGRVLVAGGLGSGNAAVDTAMIYDPAANKWTARKMGSARYGHTIHLLGGKALVIGGVNATNAVLDTTEIFHPTGDGANEFTDGPKIPGAPGPEVDTPINAPGRAFHDGAAVSDSTLMVAGGVDSDYKLAPTHLYFLADKGTITAQSRQTTLGTPVVQGAAGAVNGKFVMVGGTTAFNASSTGWGWAAASASKQVQWSEPSSSGPGNELGLSYQRYAPCVVPMDENRLLVTGGVGGARKGIDFAESLTWHPDKKTVERGFIGDSADRSKMAVGRAFPTCTNIGNDRILVTGGADTDQGNAASSAEVFVVRKR